MFNSINGNARTTLGQLPGVSAERFAEEMRAAQAQAAAPPAPAPQPGGGGVLQGIVDAVVQHQALLPPPSRNGSPLAQDEFMLAIDQQGNWPLAHYQAQQLAQKIAAESAPPVSFSGSSAQVAQEITQQFIWGAHQDPLPTDGLQQVIDGLPAALQDKGALTQKMIGLAESLLRNGASGGEDGILLDYTGAKLALEVAEQPDGGKHGVSERETMPDGGNHTYNVVITPGAPNGIGNGYAVLIKKEHGTFLSQALKVVDTYVTPLVDIAAVLQPEIMPLALAAAGLSAVQAGQDFANGHDLSGLLAVAGAVGAGAGALGKLGAISSNLAIVADAPDLLRAVSAAQGLQGVIQGAEQGNALAALTSGLGGIGGSGVLGGGSGIGNLTRDALVGSGLAGAAIAAQGGNPMQALAALTTAASNSGLLKPVQDAITQALFEGAQSQTLSQPIKEDKNQVASSGMIMTDAGAGTGAGSSLMGDAGAALADALSLSAKAAGDLLGVVPLVLWPTSTGGGVINQPLGNGVNFSFTPDMASGALAISNVDVGGSPQFIPITMGQNGALSVPDGTVIGALSGNNTAFLNPSAIQGVVNNAAIGTARVSLGSGWQDYVEGLVPPPPPPPLPGMSIAPQLPQIFSTPADQTSGSFQLPGMTITPQLPQNEGLTIYDGPNWSIYEARPTPQQSEQNVGSDLGPNYPAQQSFLAGKPVPYGTPGSVRPDFISPDGAEASFEVKNYNLNNIPALTSNIAKQAIQRQVNLPQGMQQNVIIDARGQNLTDEQQITIRNQIISKSNGIISVSKISFNSDNNP